MTTAKGTKIANTKVRKMAHYTHGIANEAIGDRRDYPELHAAITLVGRVADGQPVATKAQLDAAIRTITPVIEAARADFHDRGWAEHDTPYTLVQAARAAKPTTRKRRTKQQKAADEATLVNAAEQAANAALPQATTPVGSEQLVATVTAVIAALQAQGMLK